MDSIFLLLRPHAYSPSAVTQICQYLADAGAHVDAQDTVTRGRIRCSSLIETYFGALHYWATSPTATTLCHPFASAGDSSTDAQWTFCAAEEDLKSLFYVRYGELWDTALDQRRLLTALDFLRVTGTSAVDLATECAEALGDDVLELPTHLTITRLPGYRGKSSGEPPFYVVNGSYPAQLQEYRPLESDVVPDVLAPVCWWCAASWPTAPLNAAAPNSDMRVRLLKMLKAYPIPHAIDVVTNPLEVLACRLCWTQIPIHDDPYGRVLLRHGIPYTLVGALVRGPALHDHGQFMNVIDIVSEAGEEAAAAVLAGLWTSLKTDSETDGYCSRGANEGALALYDWENGMVAEPASLDDTLDVARTHAVVLVHPRLSCCEAVLSRFQAQLIDRHICIEASFPLSADELLAKLDLHYGAVARFALDQETLRRFAADEDAEVAAGSLLAFEKTCKVSWEVAMQEGRIWSASLAEDLLGAELAAALMRICAESAETTHHISSHLSITEISRETLLTQLNPECPVEALYSPNSQDASMRRSDATTTIPLPYRLTSASYFVVNAAYAVYRRDVLQAAQRIDDNAKAAEVWHISWADDVEYGDVKRWCTFGITQSPSAPSDDQGSEHEESDGQVQLEDLAALYCKDTSDGVSRLYPLLSVSADAATSMRERHLWWGTPYEEDWVNRNLLVARGHSWVESLPPSSLPWVHEAVLTLLPGATITAETLDIARTALHESGASIVQEVDLYGVDVFEHLFSSGTPLAIARRLAQKSGPELWAMLSDDMQMTFRAAAAALAKDLAQPLTAANLHGGSVVCSHLRIPLSELEQGWCSVRPLCVAEDCWLGYLPEHHVWVVNGHVPLLQHRYTTEKVRAHMIHIQWDLTRMSWEAMRYFLFHDASAPTGDEANGASTSKMGSLIPLLNTFASSNTAITARFDGEPLHMFSTSEHHALVDALRWPRRGSLGPLSSEVALEDWLLRRPNIRHLLQHEACTLGLITQQVHETLDTTLPRFLTSASLLPTPIPRWSSRFAESKQAETLHHGFLWLHPASTTPAVRAALPNLLLAHQVSVYGSGSIPLREALQRGLLDVAHEPFFKNAYVRSAAQVPITDIESQRFMEHFGQNWVDAVQLGLVINAKEAEQKYGAVRVTEWWDSLTEQHQAKLSDSLYVGYMQDEGLYVMNPQHSYQRSRLQTGSHEVVWYAIDWKASDMSWETFLRDVIGDPDPDAAVAGSLRKHFATHWTRYTLPGRPDQIECVLHASDSPFAALAERCRWLKLTPGQDRYGALLQSYVSPSLLSMLLSNPSVYVRETGIITELFHLLPRNDVQHLLRQLRDYQCHRTVAILPEMCRLVPPGTAVKRTTGESPTVAIAADNRRGKNEQTVKGAAFHPKHLHDYRQAALASAIDPSVACAFAAPLLRRPTASSPASSSVPAALNYAVMYLDPLFLLACKDKLSARDSISGLIEQHLRTHGVRVVHERVVQFATPADAVALHRLHHHRLYRYGMMIPAVETLSDSVLWQSRFNERFGVSYQHASVTLYNAREMARAMNINDLEVAALCRRSKSRYPRDTCLIGEGCVIQRLQPDKPFYMVNGDIAETEHRFESAQKQAGIHVWLLSWEASQPNMSYERLHRLLRELQAPSGPMRRYLMAEKELLDGNNAALYDSQNDDDTSLLHVSESAIAAVRQRQLWWRLPLWSDPTVAAWTSGATSGAGIRANAVAWALHDPSISPAVRSDYGPVYLWDTAVGLDAQHSLKCIRLNYASMEAVSKKGVDDDETRNVAMITLMPPLSSNAAVKSLVRSTILANGLHIDAYGFLADHGDGPAALRRIVQCLYPEDWKYAVEYPENIVLSADEAEQVMEIFGVSWESMIYSGRLLPALRATKKLGGMTVPELQLFVKAAKKSIWLRPHLYVTELEGYGVYVLNAHVPRLVNDVVASAAKNPLAYCLVSWSSHQWTWGDMITQVVGNAEPSLAEPGSIRGCLSASWAAMGLHAAPERFEGGGGGICVSEGPLQSLLSRLHVQWPPLDSFDADSLGSAILQMPMASCAVAEMRAWLADPVVTCDDRSVGVLAHLSQWDSSEVLHLLQSTVARTNGGDLEESSTTAHLPSCLAATRRKEREAEAQRVAEIAWRTLFAQRFQIPLLCTAPPIAAMPEPPSIAENEEVVPLLRRNVGTLLFFSHQLNATQRVELRNHLQKHGISVSPTSLRAGAEQECTETLLDRLCESESLYADREHLAAFLTATNEVAEVDQARFNIVFRDEVPWGELLANTALYQSERREACNVTADHASGSDSPALLAVREELLPEHSQRRLLLSAADAMRLWNLSALDLWALVRRGVSMRLSEGMEITRLSPDLPRRNDDAAASRPCESTATAAPWTGHYVVNGFYAALRASLAVLSSAASCAEEDQNSAPPSLIKWDIMWDSETLSWCHLTQHVIGYPDGVHAEKASFNAHLLSPSAGEATREQAEQTPWPLLCVGVMAASGPVAAFAIRRAWCWNTDYHDRYLPDPLLRSMSIAALDDAVITENDWCRNVITACENGKSRLRVFDWTRGCDTPSVLQWIRDCQEAPVGRAVISESVGGHRGCPTSPATHRIGSDDDDGNAAANTEHEIRSPPSPPPRMKANLQSTWLRDALLQACTESDYLRLWEYYRAQSVSATAADAASTLTEAGCAPQVIPFAPFYSDFKTLGNLGVPSVSHQLKHLFIEIEVEKKGLMSYQDFSSALVLFHSL